ncbi:MAG TPA: hypothetical protein VE035_11015 [Puia sp.]|nr:hypothetical protein [Puia sp.]
MKSIFLFFWILPLALYSQSVHIREIKFRPNPKFYKTTDTTIVYPVVVTGNQVVNRLINDVIKKRLLYPENSKMTLREALRAMIRMRLTDLDYEVTYNKNGILSLKVGVHVEAAYPNYWNEYFNFDIRTGQCLATKDILMDNMIEPFKSKVFADKIDSLKSYKQEELTKPLLNKELDSETYHMATGIIDDCIATINIDNFSLTQQGIEIIDPCEFPHVIRGMEPTYELKYSFQFMYPYLKSTFKERLGRLFFVK